MQQLWCNFIKKVTSTMPLTFIYYFTFPHTWHMYNVWSITVYVYYGWIVSANFLLLLEANLMQNSQEMIKSPYFVSFHTFKFFSIPTCKIRNCILRAPYPTTQDLRYWVLIFQFLFSHHGSKLHVSRVIKM